MDGSRDACLAAGQANVSPPPKQRYCLSLNPGGRRALLDWEGVTREAEAVVDDSSCD
jgi:hypothetical protein